MGLGRRREQKAPAVCSVLSGGLPSPDSLLPGSPSTPMTAPRIAGAAPPSADKGAIQVMVPLGGGGGAPEGASSTGLVTAVCCCPDWRPCETHQERTPASVSWAAAGCLSSPARFSLAGAKVARAHLCSNSSGRPFHSKCLSQDAPLDCLDLPDRLL